VSVLVDRLIAARYSSVSLDDREGSSRGTREIRDLGCSNPSDVAFAAFDARDAFRSDSRRGEKSENAKTATADFQNCSSRTRTDRSRGIDRGMKNTSRPVRARRCPPSSHYGREGPLWPISADDGGDVALSRRQLIKLHNKRKLCGGRYRLSRDAREPAIAHRYRAAVWHDRDHLH